MKKPCSRIDTPTSSPTSSPTSRGIKRLKQRSKLPFGELCIFRCSACNYTAWHWGEGFIQCRFCKKNT